MASGPVKVQCADVVSVLAMTMSEERYLYLSEQYSKSLHVLRYNN